MTAHLVDSLTEGIGVWSVLLGAGNMSDFRGFAAMSSDAEVTVPQLLPDPTALRLSALPPPFACTWSSGGLDVGWVHVVGELDLAAAPRFMEALRDLEQEARLIVLDLRELLLPRRGPACTPSSMPALALDATAAGCSWWGPRPGFKGCSL